MAMMITNSKKQDICFNKMCPKFKICPLGFEKMMACILRSMKQPVIKVSKKTFFQCKIFDKLGKEK